MIELKKKQTKLGKSFYFFDKWYPFTEEMLAKVTLADLLKENMRFMFEVNIDGVWFYIVTDGEDEKGLREKYPNRSVVNVKNIVRFFKSCRDDIELEHILPIVIEAADILKAKVI